MKQAVLSCIFLFVSFYCHGQDTLSGPHGGKLKASGFYHVEVVECYQFLEIYFYEADGFPIRNHGITGLVDFYYADNSCATSRLYAYGLEGFTAEIKRQCFTSCEVELKSIGILVRTSFTGFVTNNEDCTAPQQGPLHK